MLYTVLYNNINQDLFSQAKHWCKTELGREQTLDRNGIWVALQRGWLGNVIEFRFRHAEDAMAFKLMWDGE